MLQKCPPHPERVRKIPKQFSWLDHRLVRDHYIHRCSHQAAALYLFLVTVADAKGLSYYADASMGKILSMNAESLQKIRQELIQINLIAYKRPVYQVLPLDNFEREPFFPKRKCKESNNRPDSIGHILKKIMEESS